MQTPTASDWCVAHFMTVGNCAKPDGNANQNSFSEAIHAKFLPIAVWKIFARTAMVKSQL
jgi:hypothetical protein